MEDHLGFQNSSGHIDSRQCAEEILRSEKLDHIMDKAVICVGEAERIHALITAAREMSNVPETQEALVARIATRLEWLKDFLESQYF